ncbi:hypothetical protein Lser_V15G06282 [Lactuca serriola]
MIVELKEVGATWIGVDEATLVKDLEGYQSEAFSKAYSKLKSACSGLNVIVATYFVNIPAEAFQILTSLPGVAGFTFDLIRGEKTLDLIKSSFPSGKYLFAGVVLAGSLASHKDKTFFLANAAAQVSRKSSPRVTNESVQKAAVALRDVKRGGAWIDEVVARIRVLSDDKNFVRLPISHMVYNQMPPVGDKPSLMTFREWRPLLYAHGQYEEFLQNIATVEYKGLPEGLEIAVELLSKTSRQGLGEFKLAMFYLIWT